MDRNIFRSTLPSRVEADSAAIESRIPTLGLHMDTGDAYGCKDDYCVSGNVDSGISSMGCPSICDSGFGAFESDSDLQQTEKGIQRLTLSSHSDNKSDQFTNIDSSCHSVDEGFISTEIDATLSATPIPKDQFSEAEKIQQLWQLFAPDEEGDTQLHIAIIQSSPIAESLIRITEAAPAVLSIQNLLGQSALHLAVLTKQPNLVRLLLLRGAALDLRDRHGNTALHLACRDGNILCIHQLLSPFTQEELQEACITSFPQDLNIKNYDGETCLHIAATHGHVDAIVYLIKCARVNVDLRDGRSGRTILHYAVESGKLDLVQFLVQHCDADVNCQTFDGATPLRLAVGRRHMNVASYLINVGADAAVLHTETYEESDEEMDDIYIGGKPVRILSG